MNTVTDGRMIVVKSERIQWMLSEGKPLVILLILILCMGNPSLTGASSDGPWVGLYSKQENNPYSQLVDSGAKWIWIHLKPEIPELTKCHAPDPTPTPE